MYIDIFVRGGILSINLYIYFSFLSVFSLFSHPNLEFTLHEKMDLALGMLKQSQAHSSHLESICWMNEQTRIFQ